MMRSSASAKPAVNFLPREVDDCPAPLHVVRGELERKQRKLEGAHFAGRERIARLDGGLARNRRRQTLMSRRSAGEPAAGERIKGVADAPLRIEARMWHRDGANDERVSAKALDLEAERGEQVLMLLERVRLRGTQVQRQRKEEPL